MLPFPSAAHRLPPMDAQGALPLSFRPKRPRPSPLVWTPAQKSLSMPLLPPPNFTFRPRTESEREAAYGVSPRSCTGRNHWRNLLDSPSTFEREHGARLRPEYRPAAKEASFRVHPYARSSLDQRSGMSNAFDKEAPRRNTLNPAMIRSPSLAHVKHHYHERARRISEPVGKDILTASSRQEESREGYMAVCDRERHSPRHGLSSSGYAATNDSRISGYPPPRVYPYRWSLPHKDISDYYRSGMNTAFKDATYRSAYPVTAPRDSISPDKDQEKYASAYWRRGLSCDEGYSKAMIGERQTTLQRSPPLTSGQAQGQEKEMKTKPSTGTTTSESAPPPKRGGKLPKHITNMLKTWLLEHADHPYPTEDEKIAFCECTGLDICQISNWFVNARRRILVPQQLRSSATSNPITGTGHAQG